MKLLEIEVPVISAINGPAWRHSEIPHRGRYFLLTGQTLNAQKALDLGLVAEVLPPDKLLARAWELAEDLARRPTLLLRYTRLLLTEALRRQMHDLLGYGLGMELLALGEKPEGPA
jgi:enoyl-CoA hydratase/carnithine racemase